MPDWFLDLLSNQWTITIGGTVIAAGIIGAVGPLRRGIVRLARWVWRHLKSFGAWVKPSGLNKAEPAASSANVADVGLPAFVVAPRWVLESREANPGYYGIKNIGGTALHVRVRPESDETVVQGDLDEERIERGDRVVFRVVRADDMLDTWFTVDCRDSAGAVQPTARVRILGMLSNML